MNFPDPNLPPLIIVDDSQDDAFLLRYRLRSGDIANPVIVFEDTESAVAYFRTRFVIRSRPQLLFIDIKVAAASELITKLRDNPEWDSMKIVVITYANDERELQHALDLRIDGYVLKFPDPNILAEFVRHGPWISVPARGDAAAHALCA